MPFKAEIPYGAYWCTPFAKWQESLADLQSIQFAARVTKRELQKRNIAPDQFDFGVLGTTVPQKHSLLRLALAQGAAFLKRFMTLPFDVPSPNDKKTVPSLQGDEGVYDSTPDGLAKLKPVLEKGTVIFGGQTHPADGNAGMVLTTPDKAREISSDSGVGVRLLGFGLTRTELAHMPQAPVGVAQRALQSGGITMNRVDVIKTHNSFAVTDLVFAKETGANGECMNHFGCSLIWRRPQGPTGMRLVTGMIEKLATRGGGNGLLAGCAAGDTAMAVVVQVEEV